VDAVRAETTKQSYPISEAAALTGLPSSTLRYYESKHRVYTEDDLDTLTRVACLRATGMSISGMRR
jgi:DNA-binding transcriptional MerR regulator